MVSLIKYPLSPKIKPIITVYANVSKLPPLLVPLDYYFYDFIITWIYT